MSRTERRAGPPERGWRVALVVVLVAAAAAAPWVVGRWGSWTTSLQERAGDAPEARLDAQRSLGGAASLLVVVTDDASTTRALALLTRPEGQPGILAMIPPVLFDLLPGYGEFPLAMATQFEGPELAATAVENAIGVRVDGVVSLGPGELAAALPGGADVDLPSPFFDTGPSGDTDLVADAGALRYAGDVVEALLVTRGEDEPLAWLERQAAVWKGVLTAAAADPDVTDAIAGRGSDRELATGVIAAVAAAESQITLVPVERSAGAGDADGFTVDLAAAERFVATRVPHLALAEGPRPRAEVLNGNGRVLATRPVVEVLVRDGFRVVRTDNAERFDIPQTLVIAQGNENRPVAERAVAVLGLGVLQLELRSPSGVVDVSIIVGQDVPAGEG